MHRQKEYNNCTKKMACKECEQNSFCKEWVKFVLKESNQKPKRYAHFDKRVSLALPSIRKYVMDTSKIETHSFYPFIHFTKNMSRFGKKSKVREIYYCSHLDRCVYQRYAFLLNQKYNEHIKGTAIDNVAIAYRSNLHKNNIDFAKRAFDEIIAKEPCTIIVGDFTNFFDSLDHQYLKKQLCELLGDEKLPPDYFAIFKNITRFASWDWKLLVEQSGHSITIPGIRTQLNKQDVILSKEQFKKYKSSIAKNKEKYGIPQGSPISAILSNIYMLEFDKSLSDYVSKLNGLYMRYSDDFIVVLPFVNEKEVEEHQDYIFSQVHSIPRLELKPEKTSIYIYKINSIIEYSSKKPSYISYLGFVFDGKKIKIRPKAITKYYYRMRRKAKTIGRNEWVSPNGKHISAKKLYNTYSTNRKHHGSKRKKQTFISYAIKAKSVLNLKDPEIDAVIKHHKHKIAMAIKSGLPK